MTEVVYTKPASMHAVNMHYCPGCGHGIVHRLIGEIVDELNLRENIIGVAPVGCAVNAYNYWNFDVCEAAHGRAAAVATGIRRVHPQKLVFAYQGDGDLASIGLAETMHTANRGENLTVIFINNTNYGMTGGQLAPTTLVGQKTTTSQKGRNPDTEGYPLCMAEMIALLTAPKYVVRTTVADVKGIRETKKAIKYAFEMQMNGGGYSFIEILSNCATNWGMNPQDANNWIKEELLKVYPLGEIKKI